MKIILAIIIAVVVFEVVEHIIFPLIWITFTRRKRSVSGPTGLLGEVAVVKRWRNNEGYVYIKGELWKAVSSDHLSVGERAVVQGIDKLTLRVGRAQTRS